jgi:hypothetical protein
MVCTCNVLTEPVAELTLPVGKCHGAQGLTAALLQGNGEELSLATLQALLGGGGLELAVLEGLHVCMKNKHLRKIGIKSCLLSTQRYFC